MPISLTNVLKWGGSGAAIVFATGLIVEAMGVESGAPVTLVVVLMVAVLIALCGLLVGLGGTKKSPDRSGG